MGRIISRLSKLLIVTFLLLPGNFVFAQSGEKVKDNWQNLDLKNDSVFGISMEKAYTELLTGRKAVPVIVAVIDGGVDINHEDLNSVIWTNPGEVPANSKDDDKNGFIDDIHGWNFYSPVSKEAEKTEILSIKNKLKAVHSEQKALNQMLGQIGKPTPAIDDFKNYIPGNAEEFKMQVNVVAGLKIHPEFVTYKKINLERAVNYYNMQLTYYEKRDYDPLTDGPSAYHGTHIAGIIAADRNNNIGIKGVADHAKIMVLKAVPSLDPTRESSGQIDVNSQDSTIIESRIKAVADAIRYAADNGAKIINMSFGQPWAKPADIISEAIKYAVSKDVLIVHASGNEGQNLDLMEAIYPDRRTVEGKNIASSWLEVGASGWKNDEKLAGLFSNYGKNSVDVYAPGIEITSTVPRSNYLDDTGTSMAAPVVAGLAAVIREYFPELTAVQVKMIIMGSVVEVEELNNKCISGGVVNAYKAIKLAK